MIWPNIFPKPSKAVYNFVKFEDVFKEQDDWANLFVFQLGETDKMNDNDRHALVNLGLTTWEYVQDALYGVRLNSTSIKRVKAMAHLFIRRWIPWFILQGEINDLSLDKISTMLINEMKSGNQNAVSENNLNSTVNSDGTSNTKGNNNGLTTDFIYNQQRNTPDLKADAYKKNGTDINADTTQDNTTKEKTVGENIEKGKTDLMYNEQKSRDQSRYNIYQIIKLREVIQDRSMRVLTELMHYLIAPVQDAQFKGDELKW